MLRNRLLIWLVLGSALAAAWPWLAPSVLGDPFVAGKSSLSAVVALTMFSVGAVLPAHEVRSVMRQWPLVLGGTAVQYISMPLLAWLLALTAPLDANLKKGLILVGCVPGAMASNVLTMVARGNVSYSVGLTTTATLLSPVVVPLMLKLTLGASADSSLLWNAAFQLAWTVVLPTVLGFICSRVWSEFERLAAGWSETVAQLSILWILVVIVGINRNLLLETPVLLGLVLLALNLGGYLAGALGGRLLRLDTGKRRALILEVGMQNAGVGATLATGLFPGAPAAALPCGLFVFVCLVTGTLLAQALGRVRVEEPDACSTL